jgi:hypothetical protein
MVFVELPAAELKQLGLHMAQHDVRIRGARWVLHLDVDDAALAKVIDAAAAYAPVPV